jgi:hypothetical protein
MKRLSAIIAFALFAGLSSGQNLLREESNEVIESLSEIKQNIEAGTVSSQHRQLDGHRDENMNVKDHLWDTAAKSAPVNTDIA